MSGSGSGRGGLDRQIGGITGHQVVVKLDQQLGSDAVRLGEPARGRGVLSETGGAAADGVCEQPRQLACQLDVAGGLGACTGQGNAPRITAADPCVPHELRSGLLRQVVVRLW